MIRLFCTLTINEKKTGKLITSTEGIYFADKEDVAMIIETGNDQVLRRAIVGAMLSDVDLANALENVVVDLDVVPLSDEGDED